LSRDPVGHVVAQRRQKTVGGHHGGKARLRENGDVGRGARLGVDHDLLLETVGAGIGRLGARRGLEIGQHRVEPFGFRRQPGARDGHGLTAQVRRGVGKAW
jgi:hypothetical protein